MLDKKQQQNIRLKVFDDTFDDIGDTSTLYSKKYKYSESSTIQNLINKVNKFITKNHLILLDYKINTPHVYKEGSVWYIMTIEYTKSS